MHHLRRGGARAAQVPGGPLQAADVASDYWRLATARARLCGRPSRSQRSFTPQELGHYTNALEIDESHAPSVSNRGNCLRHLGKLQEAERDYQLAIEMDPSNAKSFANRGALLRQQGKNVRALDDFRR